MAEHSKFFDSLNPLDPDKVYTADEFLGFFGKLITDGVMKGEANMLKVETSGSNMNTIVDTGTAFLRAREYENDSKLSLTHEVESLGRSRIDRVVIRLMLNVDYRETRAFVKKGVAGVSPVVPQLERTDEVYEISLAQVRVIGGQTYINVADVVDERGNPDVCPWAGSKILPNFDDSALADLVGTVEDNTSSVAQLKNNKADRIQETNKSITLQNGSTGTVRYFKDQMNVVHMTGFISGGDLGAETLVFTTPMGYRPQNIVFAPLLTGAGSTKTPVLARFYEDGRFVLDSNASLSIYIHFSYRAG